MVILSASIYVMLPGWMGLETLFLLHFLCVCLQQPFSWLARKKKKLQRVWFSSESWILWHRRQGHKMKTLTLYPTAERLKLWNSFSVFGSFVNLLLAPQSQSSQSFLSWVSQGLSWFLKHNRTQLRCTSPLNFKHTINKARLSTWHVSSLYLKNRALGISL